MFRGSSITTRIWLSIGVFIAGYILSTGLAQIQGLHSRRSLRSTAEALFPAAQRSQELVTQFEQMVKGFGDAVIMQDSGGIDRASAEGDKAIAAIPGLDGNRVYEARSQAEKLSSLLAEARNTYTTALSNPSAAGVQDKIMSLASRTSDMRTALNKSKDPFAADLRNQLQGLEQSSATQNGVGLGVFAVTLLVAGIIVHLTIKRSITGPVTRVITGVQQAADEAAKASAQVSQLSITVSSNAQQQATHIEDTSASLEQVSANTRRNADSASEADRKMQEAREMVQRAAESMQKLTQSMALISKSSHKVAGVLKDIDGIAFQTNILALNAAVEAARAGEAGAGFSVVAGEVRSLAQRAAEASQTSSSTIEQTLQDVESGVQLVSQAQSAFQQIVGKIATGTELVSQIAISSNDQAKGIEEISKSIVRLDSITQRNLTNAQQTAHGADAMSSQVENTRRYLSDLVEVVGLQQA